MKLFTTQTKLVLIADVVVKQRNVFLIKKNSSQPEFSNKPQVNASSVTSVIAPRRNKSYLSRAVSTESCTIEKRVDVAALDIKNEVQHDPIVNKMNYAQVGLKLYHNVFVTIHFCQLILFHSPTKYMIHYVLNCNLT